MENGGGMGIVGFLIWLILVVFYVYVGWKIFVKAGQPGWASIVPIYNIYVLLLIIKKPIWWIIMFFIPLISIIFAILACLEMAKVFGKEAGFGIGLLLLGFIFAPILAFGDAKYQG